MTGFKLKNGTIFLSTEAPGGIYNSSQLEKIASLCSKDTAIVKVTEDQRLALFVQESEVEQITKELLETGLGVRNYREGLHQPISCIGELCPFFQQDALGAAMELTEGLNAIQLTSPLKIGINGCSQCCVPAHTLDISIVGDENGYRINLGGKNSQLPEIATFVADGVPPGELSRIVTQIIEVYQKKAEPEESLQDLMERCGTGIFAKALSPYSQDAHIDENEDLESTPSDEVPSDEVLSDEMPLEEMPLEEMSLEDTPLDETTLEESPSEELPMEMDDMTDTVDLNPHADLQTHTSLGDDDINPQDFTASMSEDMDLTETAENEIEKKIVTEIEETVQLSEEMEESENSDRNEMINLVETEAQTENIPNETSDMDMSMDEQEDQLDLNNDKDSEIEVSTDDTEETLMMEDDMLTDKILDTDMEMEIEENPSMEMESELDSTMEYEEESTVHADIKESDDSQDYDVEFTRETDSPSKKPAQSIDITDNMGTPDFEELTFAEITPKSPNKSDFHKHSRTPDPSSPMTAKNQGLHQTAWHVESFDMSESGDLIVTFQNQVSVEIGKDMLANASQQFIKIGNQKIEFRVQGNIVWIATGGLKLSLPLQKAS